MNRSVILHSIFLLCHIIQLSALLSGWKATYLSTLEISMQQIPASIRDEIESITFPSIPYVLLRFLKVVDNDNVSITELATLVGQDPALCARFLTVANSPALRRNNETINLDQCMITLGTKLARTIASCLVVQSVFARIAGETPYDFRGFWRHSLRVAEMSRKIAAKKGYIDIEEAYLTGLMHDVGILLLLGSNKEHYGDILRRSIDEAVLSDIEQPMIGTDHAAVGACLVDHWHLSSFMSDAILFHHKSLDEITDADLLSKIVWSAHIISTYHEKLDLTSRRHTPDLITVMSILGIDITDVADIRDQASEQVASLAEALGVSESDNARILPMPVIHSGNSGEDLCKISPAYFHLDDMVQDMALMQSLQHNLTSLCSEEDIFIAVKESAKILFGLGQLAFLLVKPDASSMSGANFLGQPALLQRIEIRLDSNSCLAAAVAADAQPYSTLDKDRSTAVSLVDVQIAHILNREGLLYVPMHTGSKLIGVLAFGISALQHSRIQDRLAWMTRFAHLAAVSINAWQVLQNKEDSIEASVTSRFELQVRRAVHEAGNPLGIIKNYLKIITQKIPDENNVHQELGILREEIDRVAHILQRLNSASETLPTTSIININDVIEGMLSLYSDSLFSARDITVEKTLDSLLSPIDSDRDSVKQILLNIWKNAAEAMPDGGHIAISTRGNVKIKDRYFVEILMRDSGPGLPPDVKQHLFKPLEPNRRPGHSGIGLSIVASLVERLKGTISCQSDCDLGTVFSILLPQTDGGKN